jgi:ABC-type Zn2+ transport system substrate-binding protein/surface adhesin
MNCEYRTAAKLYLRNMVCFRYIIVNTLHEGDNQDGNDDDNDNNHNHNHNNNDDNNNNNNNNKANLSLLPFIA